MIERNKRHYGTWAVYSIELVSRHVETHLHKDNALKSALDLGAHDHKNGRPTQYTVSEIPFVDCED